LVGYSEASKAYRIFVPARRKIIVCRDVQFEEERALRRSRDLPTHSEDQQDKTQGSRQRRHRVRAQDHNNRHRVQDQVQVFRGRLLDRIIRSQMMRRRSSVMQFHRSRTLGHDLSGISPQSVILGWQGFQREPSDEVNHQRDLGTWH
jgi:hypothetical protein